jgi:hypothetical protein
MKLRIVNANLNRATTALTGRIGSAYRLRAQFDEPAPRGHQFEWVVSPPECLERVGKTFVPDYKAEWVARGKGTVHVVATDKAGAVIGLSQVVSVIPS